MTVPRCTPHRSRICAGVLACVRAIACSATPTCQHSCESLAPLQLRASTLALLAIPRQTGHKDRNDSAPRLYRTSAAVKSLGAWHEHTARTLA
eukprot:3139571-Rhodomonas_salina.1